MIATPTTDTLSRGLIWFPGWHGPHESALSILSKLRSFNRLDIKSCLKGLHGGSVTPQWHRDKSPFLSSALPAATDAILSKALAAGCLDHYIGDTARVFLERRVRHCPDCQRRGYHPVFFQIAGVTHCPLHGKLLKDRCTHCRELLPDVQIKDVLAGLVTRCQACQTEFAGPVRPAGGPLTHSFYEAAEKAWRPTVTWLMRLNHAYISTSDLDRSDPLWQRHVAETYLGPMPAGSGKTETMAHVSARLWPVPDGRSTCHVKDTSRSFAVYKSVRRYLLKQVNKRHGHCLLDLHRRNGGGLRFSSKSAPYECLVARAFVLWRLRCEKNARPTETLRDWLQAPAFALRLHLNDVGEREDPQGRVFGHFLLGMFFSILRTLTNEYPRSLLNNTPTPTAWPYVGTASNQPGYGSPSFRAPHGIGVFQVFDGDAHLRDQAVQTVGLLSENGRLFSIAANSLGPHCRRHTPTPHLTKPNSPELWNRAALLSWYETLGRQPALRGNDASTVEATS